MKLILKSSKVIEQEMRIAIVLAICVIFSSGTYAAFAEEPIPTLNFEGGEYTPFIGKPILVPVTIEIENHEPKVIPRLNVIFENQIANTMILRQSNTGDYLTYLNINGNYVTGDYYLQLDYNGKKTKPIPFSIIREFEGEKIEIEKDYVKKIYEQKESKVNLSEKNVEMDFSTKILQKITGQLDSKSKTGKLQVKIEGPKSMTLNILLRENGIFNSGFIIDKEWPTGKYTVTANFRGENFASNEFTIKNYNKDSLLKEIPIGGTLELESTMSNQVNVLLISGTLNGKNLPEQIGIRISSNDVVNDISYADIKQSGNYETSLVLYDYQNKMKWENANYDVELVDSGTLESYNISKQFRITQNGDAVTNLNQGLLLTSENEFEFLTSKQELGVKKYHPKEMEIFGKIDSYISGTPIIISIVNPNYVQEISIYAKNDGLYSTPIIVDEKWASGHYDVYVRYLNEIQNTMEFTIEGTEIEETVLIKNLPDGEDVDIQDEVNRKKIEKIEIIQHDSEETRVLDFEFITESILTRYERLPVILENPDEETTIYNVRADEEGNFSISLITDDSWKEGNYRLSVSEDDKRIVFAEFSITKKKIKNNVEILSEKLITANPKNNYEKIDSIVLKNKEFLSERGGIHLDVSGSMIEHSSEGIKLDVFEKNKLFGQYKITSNSDGEFFGTALIDESLSPGFHEVQARSSENLVGKSEFLLLNPVSIMGKFSSKPITISQDMFIESGNLVTIDIVGLIKNYTYNDYDLVKFTILHPDGQIENSTTDTAKWGYYSHNFQITNEWKKGTYVISAKFNDNKIGHLYLNIKDFDINWLKKYTEKWLDGEISTYQYENKVNLVIIEQDMEMKPVQQDSIPDWLKMNAGKWLDGEISQKEYFDVIKYLSNL